MGMITRWRWWCKWCQPSATCQPATTFSYHLPLHHTFSPKPTKYENLQVINIASRKIILYSPLHLQPPSFHWLSSVLYICHVLLSSGAYLQSWSTSSITFIMFWMHKYLSNIISLQGNIALLPLSAPPGALVSMHACTNLLEILQGSPNFCKKRHVPYFLDRPARLIIRLLFGFWQTQPIYE